VTLRPNDGLDQLVRRWRVHDGCIGRSRRILWQARWGRSWRDIVGETTKHQGTTVAIDDGVRAMVLNTNAECLQLALRNLHENAVQHTRDGRILWSAGPRRSRSRTRGLASPPMNSIGSATASSAAG